jgi:hypothetical protein
MIAEGAFYDACASTDLIMRRLQVHGFIGRLVVGCRKVSEVKGLDVQRGKLNSA